jgi:hypothetical protein
MLYLISTLDGSQPHAMTDLELFAGFPVEIGVIFKCDKRWHLNRSARFLASEDIELSQSGLEGAL